MIVHVKSTKTYITYNYLVHAFPSNHEVLDLNEYRLL